VSTLINKFNDLKFSSSRQPGIISAMFSLATLVLINECKAQLNCIHDPTFRHSSLVSSILTMSAVLFSSDKIKFKILLM
jgi:hypothetical protein